jgi:hypothetical protein
MKGSHRAISPYGSIPERAILFFVKHPEPGRVKSRLARVLGPEAASTLYRYFVLDMLGTIIASRFPLVVCYTPKGKKDALARWMGEDHSYLPQRGRGLGQRMAFAFQEIFALGCRQAVLLGSDLPDLPTEIIVEAFHALSSHGAVIGPSHDGGYYLIGFRKDAFAPDGFRGIRWGKSTVLRKSLAKLQGTPAGICLLPQWSDVDTLEDLRALSSRMGEGGHPAPRTSRFLKTFSCLRGGLAGSRETKALNPDSFRPPS